MITLGQLIVIVIVIIIVALLVRFLVNQVPEPNTYDDDAADAKMLAVAGLGTLVAFSATR